MLLFYYPKNFSNQQPSITKITIYSLYAALLRVPPSWFHIMRAQNTEQRSNPILVRKRAMDVYIYIYIWLFSSTMNPKSCHQEKESQKLANRRKVFQNLQRQKTKNYSNSVLETWWKNAVQNDEPKKKEFQVNSVFSMDSKQYYLTWR